LKSSMPIHPEYKWFYPIDWPQLSAVIRFERAKGRCQRCGRPNEPRAGARGAAGRMAVRSGIWATVDGGMKMRGRGAMGADAALLDELVTTSQFVQPG
jgi:hypothetical protein